MLIFCDWENDGNATYDLENLFGANSENDDMESSKLGGDMIANPLPTSDVIIDNSFASKNTYLHVNHDENALCDSYIVELFMIRLKIIMRGELMPIHISILSRFLSLC